MGNDLYVTLVDTIGQRYHCRPSEILEIDNPLIALDFDAAIVMRVSQKEKEQQEPKANIDDGFESVKALQERVAQLSK